MSGRVARLAAACALALAGAGCDAASEGGALVFDPGYRLETFATNADGITAPDGLAWHGGALFVADEGGSAIRRIGPDGSVTLADRSSGLRSPEDLAVSSDGTIHFTDDTAGGVWTVANGGAVRDPRSGGAGNPTEGIALDRGGRLLVGEPANGRIAVYPADRSAPPIPLPGGRTSKPESMAFDPQGTLYVADNQADVLYRRAAGAATLEPIVRREGFSPESIAWAGGWLWITDSHNGKLYRMDRAGRLETVAQFAGSLANINGVAGDPRGNIYLSVQSDLDAGAGVILVLRKTGSR